MIFVLLFFMFLEDPKILILKNGKQLRCLDYQTKNGQVIIKTEHEMLTLPEQIIDWKATHAGQNLIDQDRKAKEAERVEAMKAAKEARDARKPIVLVQVEAETRSVGHAAITFEKNGNSIIVPVTINDLGPFNMILDTGAELTTLNPKIAQEVKARNSGQEILLGGVGGHSKGYIAEVSSLGIEGAQVKPFQFVVHDLSAMMGEQAHGLLGQDYLNHFDVNLNAANNSLELKVLEHHRPTNQLGKYQSISHAQERFDLAYTKFSTAVDELFRWSDHAEKNEDWDFKREAGMQASSLTEYHVALNEMRTIVTNVDPQKMDAKDHQLINVFNGCFPEYERTLREVSNLNNLFKSSASSVVKAKILEQRNQLRDRVRSLVQCRQRH